MIYEARFPLLSFVECVPPALTEHVANVTDTPAAEIVFRSPIAMLQARSLDDVLPTLRAVEDWTSRGYWAAGFLSYEAAPAFDPAMETHPPDLLPLASFAIFDSFELEENPPDLGGTGALAPPSEWRPLLSRQDYLKAVGRILELIARGETYQVNFTFPLVAEWEADDVEFYHRLVALQPSPQTALLRGNDFGILCASPELFFELAGERLTTRPMKGTTPRGLWPEADAHARASLAASLKDRAENVMIVDLMRNDLGRVCKVGSVHVDTLFSVEQYPTVWQMTSTVRGTCRESLSRIFAALFPCGSVTGTPKIRTMHIIRELEPAARNVYCGAVGWVAPGGRHARFSVPIRTVLADHARRVAYYYIGSGIVADSDPDREYSECLDKARVLTATPLPSFSLLETLRFENGAYCFLDAHLKRLTASAAYFGWDLQTERVRTALESASWVSDSASSASPLRVRLIVSSTGKVSVSATPLPPGQPIWSVRDFGSASALEERPPWRLAVADAPVNSKNVLLYHKTTAREMYESARRAHPAADDVLLWNEEGFVTETTIANLVVEKRPGQFVTPPLACGLLPGILRADLLSRREIEEEPIHLSEVPRARRIFLINSVRGWMRAELISP